MGIPVLIGIGPSSGTYTASPTANRIGVYMSGGKGNSGNGNSCEFGFVSGGEGGSGGFGFFNKPIAAPFSQPYSVGGAAGNTTMANVGTVNAGNNGNNANMCSQGGNNGTAGSAPLASLDLGPVSPGITGGTFVIQGNSKLTVFENTGT
jgi:hypothetical protein